MRIKSICLYLVIYFSLPVSMVEHETAYLQDNDYEDVYVSAVVNPGLFFVQRLEQFSV